MSDEESPDNVRHLPRIGSPPPPPVPPPPDLDGAPAGPEPGAGAVRISPFDAPQVPVAPVGPATAPAALRADGLDPPQTPDAGPPRTGALTLAAILAIALAAFEGLHTWIQESGPRRAEAAKHAREMELLAAKSTADADRMGAEADAQRARSRRVPSSHDYGRSALGSRSGALQRSGGAGSGGLRRGAAGPHSGPASRPGGPGGRGLGGRSDAPRSTRNASGPSGSSGRPGGGRGSGSSVPGASSKGPGPGPRAGTGTGGRGPGSHGGGTRGPLRTPTKGPGGTTGAGAGSGGRTRTGGAGTQPAAGPGGRRTPRQAVTDWWQGRKRTSPAGSGGTGITAARIRDSIGNQSQPTFWDRLGSRLEDRWKNRRARDMARTNGADWTPPTGSSHNHGPGRDRVTLRQAVFYALLIRWDKRRDEWKARGGPRPKTPPRTPKEKGSPGGSRGTPGGSQQQTVPPSGAGAGAPGPGFGPRVSVFDTDDGPDVVITSVEQITPPGRNADRSGPAAITRGQRQLPRQITPALPRAPHRPAGSRPGTTRTKEPIPMAATTGPYAAVARPGGMDSRHATDITVDGVIKALSRLVNEGMETHDDCVALERGCTTLQAAIEVMTEDLAAAHNVGSKSLMTEVAELQNTVLELKEAARRMSKNALTAAELAEAEESAIKRDYQPVVDATADAGLHMPSSRLHNEH